MPFCQVLYYVILIYIYIKKYINGERKMSVQTGCVYNMQSNAAAAAAAALILTCCGSRANFVAPNGLFESI